MNEKISASLAHGHTIDITTTGRRTGLPRRIEIVFHNMDGRLIITGTPRSDHKRAWLYNLEADPSLTFHLKGSVDADLPATARVITDPSRATRDRRVGRGECMAQPGCRGHDRLGPDDRGHPPGPRRLTFGRASGL